MGKCKDCKFWNSKTTICHKTDDLVNEKDNSSDPLKFIIDVSANDDYNIDFCLRTGPDFGCVLFQEEVS